MKEVVIWHRFLSHFQFLTHVSHMMWLVRKRLQSGQNQIKTGRIIDILDWRKNIMVAWVESRVWIWLSFRKKIQNYPFFNIILKEMTYLSQPLSASCLQTRYRHGHSNIQMLQSADTQQTQTALIHKIAHMSQTQTDCRQPCLFNTAIRYVIQLKIF